MNKQEKITLSVTAIMTTIKSITVHVKNESMSKIFTASEMEKSQTIQLRFFIIRA